MQIWDILNHLKYFGTVFDHLRCCQHTRINTGIPKYTGILTEVPIFYLYLFVKPVFLKLGVKIQLIRFNLKNNN